MKIYYLLFLLAAFSFNAIGQKAYWQQELKYSIEVKLNEKDHSLDAFMSLEYTNHSPDSLRFIWFHLWPNAYKNDKTAFSEQLLENGRTDFYFSGKDEKGYINRLDFRIGKQSLKQEDHLKDIDIIKVYLPEPLAPGKTTTITTPFHVRLSKNFSRSGFSGTSFQISQWYPKPAVYDARGWHAMPYLDQGEFFSEFGSFDVTIHVPPEYLVAATGELQGSTLKQNTEKGTTGQPSTLHFKQDSSHDFAWFADKDFVNRHDTLELSSGRIVQVFAYYFSADEKIWKNSIRMMKDAVRFHSAVIGEYPFNVITAVEARMGFQGGMEYPTITSISPVFEESALEEVLEHEIGHNWFYAILASNERDFPWMDEGLNSYYDNRYREWIAEKNNFVFPAAYSTSKIPASVEKDLVDALSSRHEDQPISTSSENFTMLNYSLIAYAKTALWMNSLEKEMGRSSLDSAMRNYFEEWKFRHPYPEDFRRSLETSSGRDLSAYFAKLDKKGPIPAFPANKPLRPAFLFSYRRTDSINFINIAPAIGYNRYDKLMIGGLVHNYNLVASRFNFLAAPMYATNSHSLTGVGIASYTWYPASLFRKIEGVLGGAHFSVSDGLAFNGKKVFGSFSKIVPAIRFTFLNNSSRDNTEKWIEWKTYIIGEKGLDYERAPVDSSYYPKEGKTVGRYLNQLSFNYSSYRVLYPYDLQVQIQQGKSFYRVNASADYFFNYPDGGGMKARLFAVKFGYLGRLTSARQFETYRFQPKLTAVRGNEDYTYSNYFMGRNEQDGFAGQQIMMRDGGLKLRTDLFQDLQGRSDNWISSLNLNTTLPRALLPLKTPIRIFLDIGTYAEAWDKDATANRFMYVAGLQVTILKDLVNIYAPLFFSKQFRDNLKTVPDENSFLKRISFSVDVHRFNLRRIAGNKFPF